MALDPSIALGVKPLEVANPVAQYAQMTQLQGLQNQNEVSQMQLEGLKRERAVLDQIRSKSMENGGPADLNEIASAYIKSGDPKFMEFGIGLQQKLKDQKAYDDYLKLQGVGAPVNAMTPAPAAPVNNLAPVGGAVPAPVAGPVPVRNAMAPPPAAPVNAMLADEQRILNNIRMLSASNDPRAKAEVDVLKTQLAEIRKIPTEVREFQYGETNPAFRDYQIKMKRAGANVSTVNLPPQEKAEKSKYGEFLVDQFKLVNDSARVAAKTLPAIDSNISIMNKDFDTGFGTETKAAGAKVLAALGVKDADKYATDAQTFLANANAAVLQRQLEQKGPQTEADAQRITQTGAQLGNTKNANKFVLDVAKAQLQRDIDQRNFYADWRTQKGTLDGAEDAWYSGPGNKSLFERPELKKYKNPASAADQIPTKGNAPAGNSVTLPDGRVMMFPDANAANQFKKAAGIR